MRHTIFLLGVLTSALAMADGLPFTEDRRHLRGDHTVLALSDQQKTEVERWRYLTLTKEQLQILRAINVSVPARLPVVSSRYDDCTCEMGPTAVWCRPGEVDIPHFLLRDSAETYDIPATQPLELSSPDAWESVSIDAQGQCSREGDQRRLDDPSLRALIEKLAHHEQADRTLSIRLPPVSGSAADKKIDEQLERLGRECAAGHVTLRTEVWVDLVVDLQGQFYQEGLGRSDEEVVALAAGMAQRRTTEKDRTLYIHLPPPLGDAADKRLEERIRQVKEACEKQGVSVCTGG